MTESSDSASADTKAASQEKAAKILMGLSYAIAAVGFAASGNIDYKWVALLAVGGPTAAGFIRHLFLWRGDAHRLGFDTPDPSWMWEVAFANLAIFVGTVIAFFMTDGLQAQVILTIVMGVYMSGAAFVHFKSDSAKPAQERRPILISVVVPIVYALVLFYMAWKA